MRKILGVIATILLTVVLSACTSTANFLYPASARSADQANLYWIIIYMSLGVFLLVWVLLAYNIIRFRRRKNDTTEPRQKFGNIPLEIVWTAIPILLVLTLFILSVVTIQAAAAPASSPKDINITVIGRQWWWEFDYPDLGIQTANELHVPVGTNVKLTLESADVIHSFWVPQLANKVDTIPGVANSLWFKADQIGVFDGHCAEFCGANHAQMNIKVFVDSPQDYQAWVTNQKAPPVQPSGPLAQRGYTLVIQGVCHSCHTLGDNKAVNPIGPNLTHVMSRTQIAGEAFPNNAEYMQMWFENNQSMKPGNDMASVHISPDDIQAALAYIMTLK